MAEVVQCDMPFVNALPKHEKSRWQRIWDQLSEFKALTDKHGALVPAPVAAKIAGVCRQRIFQLIDAGEVEAVNFQGHVYLIEASFITWARSERKAGRPIKLADQADKKGNVRAALDMAVEIAKGK